MKKILIGVILIVLIIIATIGRMFIENNIGFKRILKNYINQYIFYDKDEVLPFSIEEYAYYINEFPTTKILNSERKVGDINTFKDAKEQAEIIWTEIFGEQAKREKPYKVYFDNNSKVWLVKGTLKSNYIGGVLNIIMTQKDGKILAIWGEK